MAEPTHITHRGAYTIRSMRIGSAYNAQVFRGRELLGPRHDGRDAQQAIAAAEQWLDDRAAVERAVRKETKVPSIAAYTEAFSLIGLNASEKAMVSAHLEAPWHKLTATELAQAAGWQNWSSANLHYGGLGRKVAETLLWSPPTRRDGSTIWTMAIAVPADLEDVPDSEALDFLMSGMEHGGEFEWRMRPQVVAALTAHKA